MKLVVEPETTHVNGVAVASRTVDPTPLLRVRAELDQYHAEILNYAQMEPDQVMISVSGISARLTGIRAEISRTGTQWANRLRTSEIDPLLAQLDFQFRVHSRLLSVRELDQRMAGGQPC
jgi:uncharacterized small protein (DUF1192 family)